MKPMKLLVVIAVLQGLTLATLWERGNYQTAARAELPNAHPDQAEIISELKGMNRKMDRLLTVLESGKLEVKVAPVDDKKGR